MPEISRFYGIVIKMYFGDHPPPHFHAEYGEHEAVVGIETLTVIAGRLPPRAIGLVSEWASLRQLPKGELHPGASANAKDRCRRTGRSTRRLRSVGFVVGAPPPTTGLWL